MPSARIVAELNDRDRWSLEQNPNYPGPAESYALREQPSTGDLWVSTNLPIWLFSLDPEGELLVLNPFGEDREIDLVGDRGEFYTFIERVPGELWAGAYGGKNPNRIVRLTPSRQGFDEGNIDRLWRPKAAATNGTVIWWMGNNKVGGADVLGMVATSDAAGAITYSQDVVDQVLLCAHYDADADVLYACGGWEGIAGGQTQPRFYALDPSDLSVKWYVALAGDRPLGMLQLSATRVLVLCHLISDTVARLVLIDVPTKQRLWWENVGVEVFGRARNVLRAWGDRIVFLGDDGLFEVDVDLHTVDLIVPLPDEGKPSGLGIVGADAFVLKGQKIYRVTE